MSLQTWNELVATAIADATAVQNTTSETAIYSQTIPANYAYQGRTLRVRAFGKYSTTSNPTMIFGLRWGGAAGVLLAQTETLTMGTTQTNLNWGVELVMVFRTIGTAGTVLAFGDVTVQTTTSAITTQTFSVAGADAPAVSASLDTTVDKALALTATWGTQSASNTLTGMLFTVEAMN